MHSTVHANVMRSLIGYHHKFDKLNFLCKAVVHWMTSDFMQLAGVFTQRTAAAGRMHNVLHLHIFLKKSVTNALEWG